jgi:hypothetical protein
MPASDARPLWGAAAAKMAEPNLKCFICLSVCWCGINHRLCRLAGRTDRMRRAVVVAWQPALEQRQRPQRLPRAGALAYSLK